MPRSIQQLKHRIIQFEAIPSEQISCAVSLLECLPGVSAYADPLHHSIGVDYWVDEYTLFDLETTLANRGYLLEGGIRNRILRAEIQRDEEAERYGYTPPAPACRACGVFARTYCRESDNHEASPLVM